MYKKLFLLLFLFFSFSFRVKGLTINDLENELESLENLKRYNLQESDLSNLKYELSDINLLKNDLREKIKEKEKLIDYYKKELENKENEIKEYLTFLQISSLSNPYLEYLFDSDTYTEFIYKYGVVSQLSEYNDNLINEYNILIQKTNNEYNSLLKDYDELEKEEELFIKKYNIYRANNNSLSSNIDEDIKQIKEKISYYKSIGCKLNQDISLCENISMSTKWYYPLKSGFVTSNYSGFNVRDDYTSLGGHYGIDLGAKEEGANVYSASKGVVALLGKYKCGGNTVYIHHNINGKYYTTIYMHLLSINVREGQVVDENTVIGLMGGGSTSYLYGGYDICSLGFHLHFGVSNGHSISNDVFNANSFDPKDILMFPTIYDDSKEFFYR